MQNKCLALLCVFITVIGTLTISDPEVDSFFKGIEVCDGATEAKLLRLDKFDVIKVLLNFERVHWTQN